jgi:hypothetical protein
MTLASCRIHVVILAILIFSTFAGGKVFGAYSARPDEAMKVAPPPVVNANYSSFRGISLAGRPDNVRWNAQALGFDTVTSYFVGSDNVSAITISMNSNEVGRADFDRTGKMVRLALKLQFFSEEPIFVRKFADGLFEHYEILPSRVDDDVCFQDVTCFRGVSKFGEQFLIMRIGTDVELYVRPDNLSRAGG